MTARRTAEEARSRGGAPGRRPAARRRRPARGAGPAGRPGQRRCKSRAAAADEEIGRLEASRAAAVARADRAQHDFTALETRVAGLDAGEEGLDAEHEAALAAARRPRRSGWPRPARRPRRPTATARALAGPQGRPRARPQPQGRRRRPAAPRPTPSRGLLGSVAALLTVDTGYEAAVAAALGTAADAVAVADVDAAVARDRPPQGPTTSAGPGCCSAAATRSTTTAAGPGCPPTRRTPSTWWRAPTPCAPRWRGCCSRSPSSTTSTPPARWSPTCPTSPR